MYDLDGIGAVNADPVDPPVGIGALNADLLLDTKGPADIGRVLRGGATGSCGEGPG